MELSVENVVQYFSHSCNLVLMSIWKLIVFWILS